jgi:hypothetical protein
MKPLVADGGILFLENETTLRVAFPTGVFPTLDGHFGCNLDRIEPALHDVRKSLNLSALVWKNEPQIALWAFQLPFRESRCASR